MVRLSQYPVDPPPTTETEFLEDVTEILTGTGGSLDPDDLSLIMPEEWEAFLAALLGFVSGPAGADQNSYYDDHSNEAPLGEYFLQAWSWLPSVHQLPGYHYYDYLTQDIDPEFLEWAYSVHLAAWMFSDAGVSLEDIEGTPFQMVVDGSPITIIWHSGPAPASNLQPDPNDPDAIVVTASNGYFTVQPPANDPSSDNGHTPIATDYMDWTTGNMPYMPFLNEALQYLDDSPLALQVMIAAVQAGVRVVIVTGTTLTAYHPETNTVFWNPGMAVRLTNGGIMSPAMCLIHELAHAVGNIANPTPDSQYGNSEDRRVIVNFEQIIAAQLGEPTRNNHLGTPVFGIGSVTYHTPPTP